MTSQLSTKKLSKNNINDFNSLTDIIKHEQNDTKAFEQQLSEGNILYIYNQLSKDDQDKAKEVINEVQVLDYNNPQSVVTYGQPLMRAFNDFTSQVLDQLNRPTHYAELDNSMKDMVAQVNNATKIEDLYHQPIDNQWWLKRWYILWKQKHFDASHSINKIIKNIKNISDTLATQQDELKNDNQVSGKYYDALGNFYQALNIEIAGLEYYDEKMHKKITPKVKSGKIEASYPVVKTYQDLADQRIIDLRSIRQTILSQALSLRALSTTSTKLAAAIESSRTITLTSWKTNLVSTAAAIHQIQIAHGQRSTKETSAKMLNKGTQAVSQAVNDVNQVDNGPALDLTLLKQNTQKLMDTLDQALKLNKEAKLNSQSSIDQFNNSDNLLSLGDK